MRTNLLIFKRLTKAIDIRDEITTYFSLYENHPSFVHESICHLPFSLPSFFRPLHSYLIMILVCHISIPHEKWTCNIIIIWGDYYLYFIKLVLPRFKDILFFICIRIICTTTRNDGIIDRRKHKKNDRNLITKGLCWRMEIAKLLIYSRRLFVDG